jgi:hypothetical protein
VRAPKQRRKDALSALLAAGLMAAAEWMAAFLVAPVGLASPSLPVPLGPTHGQSCNDFDKLAFDPAVGQIVCAGGSWIPSAEPTGIRNMGTPCAPSEMDSVMASFTDGYLIWCPSYRGIWLLYRP